MSHSQACTACGVIHLPGDYCDPDHMRRVYRIIARFPRYESFTR